MKNFGRIALREREVLFSVIAREAGNPVSKSPMIGTIVAVVLIARSSRATTGLDV